MKHKLTLWAWLIFVGAVCFIPWRNQIYFRFDDIDLLMIFRSPSIKNFFTPHSLQVMPIPFLLYWAQIQLFGVNQTPFLFVSVAIHLANIYLVHRLSLRLTNSQPLALLAAVLVSFNKSFYDLIFWPTMQSNLLLTTISLLAILIFTSLETKYRSRDAWLFFISLVVASFTFAYGIGLGFVFAATALIFWRKGKPRSLVAKTGLLTSAAGAVAVILASPGELSQKGIITVPSFERISKMLYFTAVGPSQAIISRFFLPGFLPNIYHPVNIAVMIALPALTVTLVAWAGLITISKNKPGWKNKLAPLFLFAGLMTSSYFIASIHRSAAGAHKALTERYMYYPFFNFILLLTVTLSQLKQFRLFTSRLMKILFPGIVTVLVSGHLFGMFLHAYLVFNY